MRILVQTAAAAVALSVIAGVAHAQNINRNAAPTYGQVTMNAGFEPDPFAVTVMAGGPVDATRLGEDCRGRISQAPSFQLTYRANDEWPLFIGAVSDGDATIVVRAPDGRFYCNDDSNGLDPAVSFTDPRAGRYQIWVGVYSGEPIAAMVVISEVGLGEEAAAEEEAPAAGGPLPDYSLEPAYGTVTLRGGFTPDPHVINIDAGGELDARAINQPGCVGFVARAPDYRVNFTATGNGLPLVFSVNSDADTVLVINDPNDNWVCDDDGGNIGLNPSITFANPASGQYDVWVGTYAPGSLQPSQLHVSEISSQ